MNTEETIFSTPEVTESDKKQRLDKFLAKVMPDFSRSQLQRLIADGNVLTEDVVISDNSYKVKIGDSFTVIVPPAEEAEPLAENIPLEVVYEDDDLLVVNKPAGMTVHPAAGVSRGTLVNALLFHCFLSEQFAEHSIERTYYAVVYGVPNPLSGRIEGNIGRSSADRKKMAIVTSGGKPAVTHYKTLKTFKNAVSLVQCNLETGRTHQIRVHLTSVGNALVGDKVYVKNHKTAVSLPQSLKNYVNDFPRQALHAKSLGFVHPRTEKFMQFDSELPSDMEELVHKLSEQD